MGRMNIVLSDEVEKQLRLKVVEIFGGQKGSLSRAIEEAIKLWLMKS